MKFAFAADLHLSKYSQDKIEETTGLSERLYGIRNVMYDIAEFCLSQKIGVVVLGGDLLHGKSIIYTIAMGVLTEYFRSYPSLNFIIIDGNHDLSDKGDEAVSALMSLDNELNVERILTPTLKGNVMFIPYSTKVVDEVKGNSAKYLVSHFGLNEAVLNSGTSIVSDVGLKGLKGYRYALLGHYHLPQEIIGDALCVYYAGSVVQLDWGEKHEVKRFLVVDTDNDVVDSVPTKGYIKHFEFEVTPENKTEVLEKARRAKKDGHHVNIKKIEEVNTEDIEDEFRVVDRTEKDVTDRGLSSTMSLRDKIYKYMEIRKVGEDEKVSYEKVAIDLISSCEELITGLEK